jgi:hypothetical protein
VVATVTCAVLAAGALAVAWGQDSSRPEGRVQALVPPVGGGEAGTFAPEPELESEVTEEEPQAEESAEPSPALGSPSAPPVAKVQSRPTPRTAPTRTAAAAPARFTVTCPSRLGDEHAGVIQLSAGGRAVSWTATADGGLGVVPARGVLKAGARARIVVMTDSAEAGHGTVSFRSAGGSPACRISWADDGMPPHSDPPPDEEPSSSPTPPPSESPSVPGQQQEGAASAG